jgi:hypothetical protein
LKTDEKRRNFLTLSYLGCSCWEFKGKVYPFDFVEGYKIF